MKTKLKHYFHLHFIVFIWGFTAVLGKLISIDALRLVWYRMGIASLLILIFIIVRKHAIRMSRKTLFSLALAGAALALHWVTFFMAIKVSNVSIALATMSTGAFFTAILEPIWYGRKIIWYELLFGVVVIFGLLLIFKVETQYALGMLLALLSAFMSVIFTLINGKLVKKEKSTLISFYELGIGVILLSIFLGIKGEFTLEFFRLSQNDWIFIFVLASFCTAYAFIAGVHVMKYISPYTVVLTVNLEPVYGILLAFVIFGESERMNSMFYVGALIIITTVIANGILKNKDRLKKRNSSPG
ncbi:DMT family transporter [Maribacter algarum]|uniref:DMT family transporter n=1 Tax=Maribacter algarum (ex Zhang et al. 2020) TaxID=2578118 RepID=A0A5S3PMD5_9FLAO|nr:DMT family transporter [Maribacter algarum]TMM53454.1 DMT family transporter [Maribacter algarum]